MSVAFFLSFFSHCLSLPALLFYTVQFLSPRSDAISETLPVTHQHGHRVVFYRESSSLCCARDTLYGYRVRWNFLRHLLGRVVKALYIVIIIIIIQSLKIHQTKSVLSFSVSGESYDEMHQ